MAILPQLHTKAPSILATDVFGNEINLATYKSDYTLLVFLRYSGCPWCNLAIHRLTIEQSRLKDENCQIIAFVQSEKEDVINNVVNRHNPRPDFPIIADHDMKYYKLFNVKASLKGTLKEIKNIPYWLRSVHELGYKQEKIDGNFFLVPAWFLINNKTGEIVKTERGVSFYDHESMTGIYESLTFKD